MTSEERQKHIKHQLIELGLSFRAWCQKVDVPHSVARDIVYGRLNGSKSDKSRHVKEILKQTFGNDIFED